MHRVELKDLLYILIRVELSFVVPNAPCGVERVYRAKLRGEYTKIKFLMHRVELKVEKNASHLLINHFRQSLFLMHRVELKVVMCYLVPNACGVERQRNRKEKPKSFQGS